MLAKISIRTLAVLALAVLSACSIVGTGGDRQLREIRPGVLEGYLSSADQLDSKAFLLPAPAGDSATQALDDAWSRRMLELRGTPRWELAAHDADLTFPAAASTFSCALGIPVNESATPSLYLLLRRTLTDAGLATKSAKDAYRRVRPFVKNGEPTCTPQDEEFLRSDGSYPSGHTAIGWAWALILSELAPGRAEQVLARGRAYGESRNVCNAHWHSDVVAGRQVGAAAVARLHNQAEFLEAMQAARREIDAVRAADLVPSGDCEAEAAALATAIQ